MRCSEANGGGEALELLRRESAGPDPFAVAILDMQMPEVDGLMLAEAIKADAAIAPTRLIMLSSVGQSLSSEQVKAMGIDDYLVKPAKQARLHDCVAAAVRRMEKRPAKADVAPSPQPVAAATPRDCRILIADDNRINQKVALLQLRKLGYKADAVADGREALAALERIPYDVIFMDCQMPELDGYETTACIRRDQARHIHIIAITAHAMQGEREKCMEAGMDDYLTKPVRPAAIEAALAHWQDMMTQTSEPTLTATAPL